jgi:DNA mismatch repair protein MutL
VFIDKAMAFPLVGFKLLSGGKSLLALESSTLLERVLAATKQEDAPELYRELVAHGPGYSARIVCALPAVYRTDRRHVQTFVNGRRVQEYGIIQALEYAYRGALPGGAWPFVYAFVQVDPEYADFNIHPAKKEVRLKNIDEIRSGLIRAIRDYLGSQSRLSGHGRQVNPGVSGISGNKSSGSELFSSSIFDYEAREIPPPGLDRTVSTFNAIAQSAARGSNSASPLLQHETVVKEGEFRYIGRALGVFLAFEMGEELFLLDQHAAHERCLYDDIMSGKSVSQELLIPVVYEPESDDEDAYIEKNAPALSILGYRLRREGGAWLLEAAPAILPESVTGSLFSLLRARPDPLELVKNTAAQAACRAAVKDGDVLDETGAKALIEAAIGLPEPLCPHGRPIWCRLSRDTLFHAVRRIV